MPFPQSPYNVRVGKVQVNSVDVSGAQFRLKNTTKGTETIKTSSETDSNITINLAECGDWDLNDNINILISYNGKVGSSTHQVVSGDNGSYDFGTIAFSDAGAWLAGYSKRKPLVLTGGASGAQTDFQIKLAVAYAATMQGDFDDLRFTQADGTTLIDAWLESKVDDTSAVPWVEFPTTPANTVEQTYYMYYGNGAAASDWDIGATFLFGDDFPGSALDTTNKWTIKDGSCSVLNGYAQPYGLPNFVITKNYTATNVVLHTKFILNSAQAAGIVFRSTDEVRSIADFYMAYLRTDDTLKLSKVINEARTDFNSKAYTQGAATYEEHITYNGTALDVDIWKGAASDSLAATGDDTRSDGRIGFINYTSISEGDFKIDYIFTRKYAANPPTYAFGSEESPGHPTMRRWGGIPGMQYTGRRSW